MKKTNKLKQHSTTLLLLLSLWLGGNAWGQGTGTVTPVDNYTWTCGFNTQFQNQILNAPTKNTEYVAYENSLVYKQGGTLPQPATPPYVIPVVFHVIQNASAPVAINYNQILWQLAAMNAAFANSNASMYGTPAGTYATNTQISFCLAKNVPAGTTSWSNPSEYGVMSYTTTNNAILGQIVSDPVTQGALLGLTHPTSAYFPFNQYLNIWVVPNICGSGTCPSSGSPSVIGYATFPSINPTFDGIVMRIDAIGDNTMPCNGFSSMISGLDKGRILNHEIGHYFGLFHTFENAPSFANIAGCYGTNTASATTHGDRIADTPPTSNGSFQGPVSSAPNTCAETYTPYLTNYGVNIANPVDQVENYMSYNDDNYMTTFTRDQTIRMWGSLDVNFGLGIRQNLVTTANLAYTGVSTAPSCGPGVTNVCFTYSVTGASTCSSTTIQFFAPSGASIPVTYLWNFGDGTSSAAISPLHTYNTAGVNITATLTVTNINTGAVYSTSQTFLFSANSVSIAPTSSTLTCKGSEAGIKIVFGGFVNQTTISINGVPQIINRSANVNNIALNTTLCSNTTYSLNSSCNGGNSVVTFSVNECGANMAFNGDFNLGNTGFTSNLGWSSSVNAGCYNVGVIPTSTLIPNATGNALIIDGITTGGGCSAYNVAANCTNCIPPDYRRTDWQQSITGILPNTKYYAQYMVTKSQPAFTAPIAYIDQLFLEMQLVSSTSTLLATGANTLLASNSWTSGSYEYVLYSYTFTTPATVSSTYSLQVNQVMAFNGTGYDYYIDNIALRQMNTPTLTAMANPTLICVGNTATLTANGAWSATNFTWTPSSLTGTAVTVSPASTTIYTVTGNDFCKSKATVTVVAQPAVAPTITISPASPTICAGQNSLLTASGALSYTWSTTQTTAAITVTPTTTTVYTVTGKNACNLSVTKTVTVTVKTVPVITITNTLSTLCSPTYSTSLVTFTATPSPNTACTWAVYNANTNAVVALTNTLYTSPSRVQYNLGAYQTGTVALNFCATTSGTNACATTSCVAVYPCCPQITGSPKQVSTTYASSLTISTGSIGFSGTITINSGVSLTINNTNVFIDPNTKFILNGNATFNTRNTYMHGCYAMWDGIYANGTANTIKIDKSVITDALSAVNDPNGGANINLTGNYFNKNQQSIYFGAVKTSTSTVALTNNLFTCSNVTLTATSPWFTTVPNLTNAPTFSTMPITTMLPPYAGKHSYIGINASFANKAGATNSVITIGGATNGTENVFDKLKTGVMSYYSCVALQNNVFQSIKTSTNNSIGGLSNIACALGLVDLTAFFGGSPLYNSIGGASSAQKNTFNNCDNGVYSIGSSSIVCTYNRFEKQTTGVYVTGNSLGRPVNVSNNNFTQNLMGVYMFNNGVVDATVKDNNFDNSTSAVGTYSTNYAIRTEEATLATNPLSYPKYTVNNNNIKNYYNGIWSAQTLSTTIIDNEVHMVQDNTTDHWQRGIRVINSNTAKVNNNIIDMTGLNPWGYWQQGIDMGSNQVPRVQCNSVTNVCMGLTFGGANVTAPGDGIIGNYLQNNGFGMWLVNNGEIGNQYKTVSTTTLSADNAWANYSFSPPTAYFTFAQNYSNVMNGGTSNLFTRNAGIYNLPAINVNKDAFSFFLLGTNSAASYTNNCNNNTATPTNLKLGANAFAKLMQDGEIEADDYNLQGATMSLNAMANLASTDDLANNTANKKAIKHYQLYRNIQLQNIDSTGSNALHGFINSTKNDNVGQLFKVDTLIHSAETKTANIVFAKTLNNAITPSNKVEQTHQAFNGLYLEYLGQNKNLASKQIQNLESVALKCPAIYGNAVYQARTILFNLTRKSYMSDCEKISKTPSTKKLANTIDENHDILVYPNPATNELFVFAKNYEQVVVKLYNMVGALVLNESIVNAQNIDITALASGVYIYKVYANDAELKIGKLIISK